MQRIARSNKNNEEDVNFFIKNSINWKMIPFTSPHFSEMEEAEITTVKLYLKRVTGETILIFKKLSTLLSQIEAIRNSRPLIKVSDSKIGSLDELTSSHLLINDVINQ